MRYKVCINLVIVLCCVVLPATGALQAQSSKYTNMSLGVLNSGRPVSLSPGFAQAQRFLPSGKKAPSSVPTSKSKGPCSEHVCSLGGSSQSSFIKAVEAPTCQRSAGTAGAASSSSHAAVSADSWWKENLDVWTLVHSEAEFQNVLEGAKDKIVVVGKCLLAY